MEVQKIACTNNAAFVMHFYVSTDKGLRSPDTGNYPIDKTRLIDLADLGISVLKFTGIGGGMGIMDERT